MAIEKELLDQLLVGRDPNEVFAKDAGLTTGRRRCRSALMLNSTSTWMVSGLKAAPIAATAIRRSQFGLGTSKILLTSLGGCGRRIAVNLKQSYLRFQLSRLTAGGCQLGTPHKAGMERTSNRT